MRIPWEDLPHLDIENNEKGEAALRKKYGYPPGVDTIEWGSEPSLIGPADDKDLDIRKGVVRRDSLEPGTIETDILPTGDQQFSLFMLCQGRMSVFKATRNKYPEQWKFKEVATLRAGFEEPFLVYGTPEVPYFITPSGRVFGCVKPEKGPRKIEAIWSDPEKPVKTVLTDTDSNRTFVLGPDWSGDKPKHCWFELAPAPKLQEVNEKEWPKTEGVALALRPQLEFALYLKKLKQLKFK